MENKETKILPTSDSEVGLLAKLYAKLWRFKIETNGHNDYMVYKGKNYIGLICGKIDYQLVLDGRGIGVTDKLWKAKIKFIVKYYVTRMFGV